MRAILGNARWIILFIMTGVEGGALKPIRNLLGHESSQTPRGTESLKIIYGLRMSEILN